MTSTSIEAGNRNRNFSDQLAVWSDRIVFMQFPSSLFFECAVAALVLIMSYTTNIERSKSVESNQSLFHVVSVVARTRTHTHTALSEMHRSLVID